MKAFSAGTTVLHLDLRSAEKNKIFFPNKAEQQKIGSILSKVDELVQKTDQIIEQTQRLKKGLMRRLLTKGLKHTNYHQTEIGRVPVEWKISTIGKEFKLGTGGTPSRIIPPILKVISHGLKLQKLSLT